MRSSFEFAETAGTGITARTETLWAIFGRRSNECGAGVSTGSPGWPRRKRGSRVADGDVVVERRVAARPETLFKFFSDGRRWLLWQGVEAEIELKRGGAFRVNVTGDGFVSGQFIDIIPNRKVVFTWGWERPDSPVPPGSSIVEIELIDVADGTLLRLTHKGLPESEREIHRVGWENYTVRLAAVGEGLDPGPDPLRTQSEE
jgi:uncharacterized protein YndB with AHSA1/START domain